MGNTDGGREGTERTHMRGVPGWHRLVVAQRHRSSPLRLWHSCLRGSPDVFVDCGGGSVGGGNDNVRDNQTVRRSTRANRRAPSENRATHSKTGGDENMTSLPWICQSSESIATLILKNAKECKKLTLLCKGADHRGLRQTFQTTTWISYASSTRRSSF